MKDRLKKLIPTQAEVIAAFVLSLAVLLAANSKQLVSYYGLQSSDKLIKANTGHVLHDGLRSIDSLTATDGVVTFLIWAFVGIICFGIVEGIGRTYQEFKIENDLSSGRYIRPATFTKTKFWRGVVVDTLSLGLGFAMLAAICLLFALLVFPLGLAYSRVFLFNISIANAVNMLLGTVLVFAGLYLVDVAVRFLLHRRRVIGEN
jgi:type IV secretory pathway TrbL component